MTVTLAAISQGEGSPIVILHGLFGSARNWAGIAQGLAKQHRVVALDLRNHGGSPWAEPMSYPAMAEDVAAAMTAHGLDDAILLGHSMGGKVAMQLAAAYPGRVRRLIVADIAPLRYPPDLGAYIAAMQAVDLTGVTRRAEVDAALAATIPEAPIRGFLVQNLILDGAGARWRLNLAVLASAMGVICDTPFTPDRPVYRGPTLFLRGALSGYVPPDALPMLRRLFPAAELVTIANAGHWLHAEQPAAFLAAVSGFLG